MTRGRARPAATAVAVALLGLPAWSWPAAAGRGPRYAGVTSTDVHPGPGRAGGRAGRRPRLPLGPRLPRRPRCRCGWRSPGSGWPPGCSGSAGPPTAPSRCRGAAASGTWPAGTPAAPGPATPGRRSSSATSTPRSGPAVFYRLRELRPGDRVEVVRAGGSRVALHRRAGRAVPQAALPHRRRLLPHPDPEAAPGHLRRRLRPGHRPLPRQRDRVRQPQPLSGARPVSSAP